jgi:hypothetical protein
LWESRSPPTLILSPQVTEGFFCAPNLGINSRFIFWKIERIDAKIIFQFSGERRIQSACSLFTSLFIAKS